MDVDDVKVVFSIFSFSHVLFCGSESNFMGMGWLPNVHSSGTVVVQHTNGSWYVVHRTLHVDGRYSILPLNCLQVVPKSKSYRSHGLGNTKFGPRKRIAPRPRHGFRIDFVIRIDG
jgi:hypothetical protein